MSRRRCALDARTYLEQLEPLHATIVLLQERATRTRETADNLRSMRMDGMPHGTTDGKALENAIAEYAELVDAYVGELQRWTALERQAERMFDRAREVLSDGRCHAICDTQLVMCELHYMRPFLSYEQVRWRFKSPSGTPFYAKSTVKWYCDQAVEWLDYSRGLDGMPLVPIVSE